MPPFIQLAPMLGLTDKIFINTIYRQIGGFDEIFLPYMVATNNSLIKENVLRKRLDGYLPAPGILVPQLLSNEAKGFVHFANLFYDLGFPKVNWNLGCPQPFVTKKEQGAGLLIQPGKLKQLLDEILPGLKPELSIKTRLGFYSANEAHQIIELLNDYPLCELILHARTAVQQYSGNADKQTFYAIQKKAKMPVVYNGDIVNALQFDEITNQASDLKGIMIGRGAFMNPLLSMQIKGTNFTELEKRDYLKGFFHSLLSHVNLTGRTEQGILNHSKEHWAFFSKAFVQSDVILQRLLKIDRYSWFEHEVYRIVEQEALAI